MQLGGCAWFFMSQIQSGCAGQAYLGPVKNLSRSPRSEQQSPSWVTAPRMRFEECIANLDDLIPRATRYHGLPVTRFRYHDLLSECLQYVDGVRRAVADADAFQDHAARYLKDELLRTRLTSPSQCIIFLRECLRKKGIVPKPKLTAETYANMFLDILLAEFRWDVCCAQQSRDSVRYMRFNPERGRLPKTERRQPKPPPAPVAGPSPPTSLEASCRGDETSEASQSGTAPRLCRQCQFVCPVPTRSFCSPACLHLYKIRSSGGYVRKSLLARDAGICDNCGLDTERLRIAVNRLFRHVNALKGNVEEHRERLGAMLSPLLPSGMRCTRLNKRGVVARGHFWHADHILAVSHGGGNTGLDGYRTLCVHCHRQMTAQLRKPLPPPPGTAAAASSACGLALTESLQSVCHSSWKKKNQEKCCLAMEEEGAPSEQPLNPETSELKQRVFARRRRTAARTPGACADLREELEKTLFSEGPDVSPVNAEVLSV